MVTYEGSTFIQIYLYHRFSCIDIFINHMSLGTLIKAERVAHAKSFSAASDFHGTLENAHIFSLAHSLQNVFITITKKKPR